MNKQERADLFIQYFSKHQPEAQTELHYSNPFELLVSVILSAQCTDKRVNIVTPPLFERFPTAASLAKGTFEEVYSYIKSVSFANNKTKYLLGMASLLVEKYNSQIPDTVEELQKLPGVGRKTAHVITSVIYNQPNMAVDTHVFRVSKRIGLVSDRANTPLKVEKELVKLIREKYIAQSHHWLILHGRYICVARKPKCSICPITSFCLYFSKNKKKPIVKKRVKTKRSK